jgi:hypothetical protein
MRLSTTLALLACAATLLLGCGGGSSDTTGAQSLGADASAPDVQRAWDAQPSCMRPPGASRWGCSVGAYRCQAVVTDRGWSVSCARPGRSISFTVPRQG